MASAANEWIGSVYLFIQSQSTSLPAHYDTCKSTVYTALRTALSEFSGVSRNSIEILKIHRSDHELILHLKFCGKEPCRRFLQNYREKRVQQHIQNRLSQCLTMESIQVCLELKVDNEKLDTMLEKEEQCLQYIFSVKPTYQKDDELAELDKALMSLSLEPIPPQNSSSPSSQCSLARTLHSFPSEGSTFQFQGKEYVDRPLTSEHHQRFAKLVGKSWKKVGRSLKINCRALQDPAIDNLAYEYEKEGLYEQAYQMLRRFIDCEGKKATLQRLVDVLVENDLNGVAEDLVSVYENGFD